MKVVHVITGLNTGGAEMMLYKLLAATNKDEFNSEVVSLMRVGPMGKRIEALGVPVHSLNMRRGIPNPAMLVRLTRYLRGVRPDLVQTWMYHADLLGGMAARRAGCIPVIWNVQNSTLDRRRSKRLTRLTARSCARLSRKLPTRIVCCAQAGREVHARWGYDDSRMLVIPNGFDIRAFAPDSTARAALRQELHLASNTLLVGMAGRFDPQKDYANFVQAAGILRHTLPLVHFVLCGDSVTPDNSELTGWLVEAGVAASTHLLGRRQDMPSVMAGLDIATLSSAYGEAFPNVLGEAMACGIPCVATDVGDSREIIADTGRVVPSRSPDALANAWREMLLLPHTERQTMGTAARARVVAQYDIDRVTARYESLYRETVRDVSHKGEMNAKLSLTQRAKQRIVHSARRTPHATSPDKHAGKK